jgi:hypothetical protein
MMTRRRLSVALVVLVLLGGCSGPDAAFIAELQRAEQGDVDAQFNVANAYDLGVGGVQQNDAEAAWWYLKAAEQGNADAQYFLGAMYSKGEGVPKDLGQGVAWYRRAADQGDALAQASLALAYESGQGVIKDDVEALKWRFIERTTLELETSRVTDGTQELSSVEKELRAAVLELSNTFTDFQAEQMTPAQIAEAQTLAREWQAAFDAR